MRTSWLRGRSEGRRHASRVAAAALAAVLFTTAAGSDDSDGTSGTSGTEPVPGGELEAVMQIGIFRGLDPARTDYLEAQYNRMVYDVLVQRTKEGTYEPHLADSVETNDDFTEWTITLRPDVTFQDDTPFNAEAVKAYWDRIMDPATASPSFPEFAAVEEIEVVDDLTLVVHLSASDSTFIEVLVGNPGNVPSPTAVEQHGENYGVSAEAIVGAGPFRIVELVPGDRFTFERYENYWNSPKPYLDRIVMRPVADPQTRYNLFVGGGIDLFETWSPGEFPQRLAEAADAGEHGVVSAESAIPSSGSLCWNSSIPPTNDERVRQAAYYAVDFPAAIERSLPFAQANEEIYPGVPYPESDPDLAQQLIDEYLAETGASEVRLNLQVSASTLPYWEALVQDWSRIDGLNATIDLMENTEATRRITQRDYDNAVQGATPLTPRGVYLNLRSGSSTNVPFFENERVDEIGEQLITTGDPEETDALMREVAEILLDEMPCIPGGTGSSARFFGHHVHGVDLWYQNRAAVIPFDDVWIES